MSMFGDLQGTEHEKPGTRAEKEPLFIPEFPKPIEQGLFNTLLLVNMHDCILV